MSTAGGSPDPNSRPGKHSVLGGLLAALIFLAVWVPWHPARPHLPTSDLYTHLSVARHLCRGEGFVTDMAYPLSFAFPFARKLPQPLIHRGPGYPLLLVLPHLASGGDPEKAVAAVRVLQLVLLGLTVWIGATAFLARGRKSNLGSWLVLLGLNPLLVFAVDWGFVELGCGLLLLALWLRVRDQAEGVVSGRSLLRVGLADGLLAGLLVLLRLDLLWIPLLWWILLRRAEPRRLLLAMLVIALTLTPWAVRNQRQRLHQRPRITCRA